MRYRDSEIVPTGNVILTPTRKLIGKNTDESTKHNISENDFKCDEDASGRIGCDYIPES